MKRSASVLLLLSLTACATSGPRYLDRNMDFGAVKTVAVLPFQNLSRDGTASERVRDVFSTTLLATGAVYVLPQGEVARGISRAGVVTGSSPSTDEVMKLGQQLKCEAVITGVVKEHGEVRSGSASANVVSITIQMLETTTGRVVWAGSTTKGKVTLTNRLFGTGGPPLNEVTEAAVDDLISNLFK